MPILSKKLSLLTLLLSGSVSVMAAQVDFNGDGRADVLLHSEENGNYFSMILGGQPYEHPLQHPTFSTIAELETGNEWIAVAQADFNQDGKTDIWWHHPVTGENILYWMDGNTATSMQTLAPRSAEWVAMLSGDFNHDGIVDVIWRQQVSGALQLASYIDGEMHYQPFWQPVPWEWDMLDVGDLDQDGASDVMLRNRYSGRRAIVLSKQDGEMVQRDLESMALRWQFMGSGNVNGDGATTLLWRDVESGENLLEDVAADFSVQRTPLNTINNDDWRVLSVGDFDGDQQAEILWFEAELANRYRRLALYHIDGNEIANIDVSDAQSIKGLGYTAKLPFDKASSHSKYSYYLTPWFWGALDGQSATNFLGQHRLGACIERAMQAQALETFAQLKQLSCDTKSLDGLSDALRYIPNLEVLELSGIRVSSERDFSGLQQLTQLKQLQLSRSTIPRLKLPELATLQVFQMDDLIIHSLDLSQLSTLLRLKVSQGFELHQLLLPEVSQLQWLDISGWKTNQLQSLDLSMQTALQGLVLSELSGLNQLIPPNDSSALQTVWLLNLPVDFSESFSRSVPDLSPLFTSGFLDPNLAYCVRNTLVSTPNVTLSTLTHLSCVGQRIKGVTGLSQLSGLETLDLSDNAITTIDLQAFPALQSVVLDSNDIVSYQQDGLNLTVDTPLQMLSLRNNPLSFSSRQWLKEQLGVDGFVFEDWSSDPQLIACLRKADAYRPDSLWYDLSCNIHQPLQGSLAKLESFLDDIKVLQQQSPYLQNYQSQLLPTLVMSLIWQVDSLQTPLASDTFLPILQQFLKDELLQSAIEQDWAIGVVVRFSSY